MIDTVLLEIAFGESGRLDSSIYDVKHISHFGRTSSFTRLHTNQFKALQKSGIYVPVVNPIKHKDSQSQGYAIEVQASLPKLLYGTNLWEVGPKDLPMVYQKLQEKMGLLGVYVGEKEIMEGTLKHLAFAKNIRLPPWYGSARQVIRNLGQVAYKPRSTWRHRDYIDDSNGCCLRGHNTTQGLTLYDKFGEVIANGKTQKEAEVKKWLSETQQKRNLLRIEFTLQRKQSLEAYLRSRIPNRKKDFTLADVMSDTVLARSVLLEEFNNDFNNEFAVAVELTDMKQNNLDQLLAESNMSFEDTALIYYLVSKASKIGVQAVIQEMKTMYSPTTFRRHKERLSQVLAKLPDIQAKTPYLVQFLRGELEEFKLISPPAKS